MKNKIKILEIGPYPPPFTGWGVRIQYVVSQLRLEGFHAKVLNIGPNRRIPSPKYITVENGFDFIIKVIRYLRMGYTIHMHTNGDSLKGFVLTLIAEFCSCIFLKGLILTFHAGPNQIYFPTRNSKLLFPVLYTIFVLPRKIICNNNNVKQRIMEYGISSDKILPIQAFSVQYLNYVYTELPEQVQNFIKMKKRVIICYLVLRNGFFIETVIDFLRYLSTEIGVILVGINEIEDDELCGAYEQLKELESKNIILSIPYLNHDEFMTLLDKCDIYLRTPVTDGVASSVLEALSQNVPVVASDNGGRPESVIIYNAEDPKELYDKISEVLNDLECFKKNIVKPKIKDTIKDEVNLLVSC